MSAYPRHELLDALRPISRPRVRACRRKRISPTVQVQRRPDGGTSRCGVLSCGSVWACPVCAPKIYQGRADELKGAMLAWAGVTLLLTATLRHWDGNDLRKLRKALSAAWRSLWAGKAGMRRRKAWGLRHTVRALEVTHGSAGWHPHLHVLAFVGSDPAPELVEELQLAWCRAVERRLGAAHTPSFEHGLDVRRTSSAEYLAKLGLEVASIADKGGRSPTSRTPWQIAQDAAAGDEPSRRLWRSYCADMLGARQLCWSKGAKVALGVVERSDAELVQELGVGHVLAEWTGADWDACARAFPLWSSMVENATQHAHCITELHKLPLAKAQSPPGVIRLYTVRGGALSA